MNQTLKLYLSCSLFTLFLTNIYSQGQIHGNFQVIAQTYDKDSLIGANAAQEKMLMNGFCNLIYTNKDFTAGIRYETYLNVLQGFPNGYKGTGIPYRFAQYRKEQFDITVGSFYEQFGSGMILRAYEERMLGYDNAFEGLRVKINPYKGIYLKSLYGKQRLFMGYGPGIVRGIDGEISVNELLDTLLSANFPQITLGGSFVSRYQDPTDLTYILPANVGSWAYRVNIAYKDFNLFTEYVYKINDPSADNNFIYKPGQGFLTTLSYATNIKNGDGLGILAGYKYVDNLSFRSDIREGLQNLFINYMPALTKPHTYNLAATLYPYATQPLGEWALQGELFYKFKKGSALGGKYGTQITINASTAYGIHKEPLNDLSTTRQGYKARIFKKDSTLYFSDINVEIRKKISEKFKFVLMYLNIAYNMEVVQGLGGKPMVFADIYIADLNYKINKKHNLRLELQALQTKQDQGDWATVLLEYTVSPHWFVAVLDQYNYGNKLDYKRLHYPYYTFGYINGSNRISIGYGKQRAGLFCVGGVCRPVPASNGLTVTITSSF
jgi:hypothetical protein